MDVQLIFIDLNTDGAVPVSAKMSVDYESVSEMLDLEIDALDLKIQIPLYSIGMLLGDDGK